VDERVIVSRDPLNAETRLDLQEGVITPTGRHYVRSHFSFPAPPAVLKIGGAVRASRAIQIEALRGLPPHLETVTLECAGNGRAFLDPPAPGEQWTLGAVSTATWTGVTLRTLLEPSGLSDRAIEILFRGADSGEPAGLGRRLTFERSLPIERALADDVFIAFAMNGEPLPQEHGWPARLIVPSWYGIASVKWLAEIVALEQPFRGFYQAERYVIEGRPVTVIKPRAVVTAPLAPLRAGEPVTVRGYAWSGQGPIERVDVSTDGGSTWNAAALGPAASPVAWREWTLRWTPGAGAHALVARATDGSGDTQPTAQRWNALGYENNAAQPVRVEAR
jgi:DMSO/TMAO reductase YedYZ molybdopterin-dependent catalytic subunit